MFYLEIASTKEFEKKKFVSWKQIDYETLSLVIRDTILGLPSQPVALYLDYNVGMVIYGLFKLKFYIHKELRQMKSDHSMVTK